jgi:exodeoxyribonuclease VII small subunit
VTYEDAIKRLDEIVLNLSDGNLTLDTTINLYSEGVKLIKFCEEQLNKTKLEIEILASKEDDRCHEV